jgi:hypothetical protein
MNQEIRPCRTTDQVGPLQIQANRVLHGARGGSCLVLVQAGVYDVHGGLPSSMNGGGHKGTRARQMLLDRVTSLLVF